MCCPLLFSLSHTPSGYASSVRTTEAIPTARRPVSRFPPSPNPPERVFQPHQLPRSLSTETTASSIFFFFFLKKRRISIRVSGVPQLSSPFSGSLCGDTAQPPTLLSLPHGKGPMKGQPCPWAMCVPLSQRCLLSYAPLSFQTQSTFVLSSDFFFLTQLKYLEAKGDKWLEGTGFCRCCCGVYLR